MPAKLEGERDTVGYLKIIRPDTRSYFFDLAELRRYSDLFFFLSWRHIRVRYAQTALGLGWALVPPFMSMIVFTIVFGGLARVSSNGAPYPVFSFAALVPWTYFANVVTAGTNAFVANPHLITRVYFPRLFLPVSVGLASLVDLTISTALLLILAVCMGQLPTTACFAMPLFILILTFTAVGVAAWTSALAIQYRDVRLGLGYVLQLLMYLTPVVYAVDAVPSGFSLPFGVTVNLQQVAAVNPLVCVVQGFRASVLATEPLRWDLTLIGGLAAVILATTGCAYFKKRESIFADVA